MILMGTGFDVKSELAGATGRLDLHVELPDRIHLIIELKHRRGLAEPSPKAKNHALAAALTAKLHPDDLYRILAPTARRKMKTAAILSTTFDFNFFFNSLLGGCTFLTWQPQLFWRSIGMRRNVYQSRLLSNS